MTAKGFAHHSRVAVDNIQLRTNLKAAAATFKSKRDAAFAVFPAGKQYRELARDIRDAALDRLPQLLRQLETSVRDAGGEVHWACDADAANAAVLDIAQREKVSSVVKGKSMITEEIGLNQALQKAGLEVFETDLAEYIIQLAGEGPSHLIAPAVHKNREEIADLFHRKLGVDRTSDPEELTRIARQALRQRFLNADMGVTGANMAVARTGSIVLVENEGNIRMSTTLPRVHVAVMSIEKVIPSLAEAALLLALLPRSATGQKLSSYVSVLTGPRKQGEADGAQSFHLILLDNGRSDILADPDMREILRCLRCGACLNVCPVYEKVGGHSYGWVYSGPVGSILTALLGPEETGKELGYACTQCGACADVCPVCIDQPRLHMALRKKLVQAQHRVPELGGLGGAKFYARVCSTPGLYRIITAAARTLDPTCSLAARLPVVGRRLTPWTSCRTLPRWRKPFARRWSKLKEKSKERTNV